MQLVAYGAQDFYLTGNPQITFFKSVYRRHTNFACENVEQTFSGQTSFGNKAVCNIQRSGDLITKMYLRTTLVGPDTGNDDLRWAWVARPGHALMTEIQLDIGGTQIDKHYGDWLNVWYELARNFAHDEGYDRMIGNTAELTTLAQSHEPVTLWVPLQFACCRNDGLALPIIALQYHDIKVSVTFNTVNNMVNRNAGYSIVAQDFRMESTALFVDYVYLDNEERKRFAQASHEYLIEELQFTGAEAIQGVNNKFRLNFNHPCKELVWVAKMAKYSNGSRFLAYNPTNSDFALVEATKRFALRTARYAVGGLLDLGGPSNGPLLPVVGLSASLLAVFTAIAPMALSTTPTSDNITVVGRLLTVAELSTVVDELFAGLVNANLTTASSGHPNYDIVVYQHHRYGVYLDGSVNPCQQALLQLNSHDRFTKREGAYFNHVQPYQHHTNTPTDGVNVYSFALKPEEHQPSGTCNMSRIDNATLSVDFNAALSGSSVYVYATNYNVLRVMSGMAGLAYSN